MKITISVLASAVFVVLVQQLPAQVVLYDGSMGTTPAAQGWQFLANPIFGNTVMQILGPGYVTLDSTSTITDQAGYFSANPILPSLAHPDMPIIDRLSGYDVRFDLRVNIENHVLPPARVTTTAMVWLIGAVLCDRHQRRPAWCRSWGFGPTGFGERTTKSYPAIFLPKPREWVWIRPARCCNTTFE